MLDLLDTFLFINLYRCGVCKRKVFLPICKDTKDGSNPLLELNQHYIQVHVLQTTHLIDFKLTGSVGSHDETIRVWDLNSLQCKHTLKAKDKVEALLATPQALFSASGDYIEVLFLIKPCAILFTHRTDMG